MSGRGRISRCIGGRLTTLALLAGCLAMNGCVGPEAVRASRLRYNSAVATTNKEQLLLNLVRLRYAESPVFLDLPTITSQFELAAGGGAPGGQLGNLASYGIGGATGRDSPTLTYQPRQGREVAKALLTPLSADLFSVVNAGASLEQLFWMTLNDINDVPNAIRATTLVPQAADENLQFLRGVHLLADVDDRGGAEIGFATAEDDANASDPIPATAVDGGNLLAAAKENYVFRVGAGGRVTLHKRDREPTLKIRSRFARSPEMTELAAIFHLAPGRNRYKIVSDLEPDDDAEGSPLGVVDRSDTIYLNLRSVLQIMIFLSKGVCVPTEHVCTGVAPTTPGFDGRPFDWREVMAGNFAIASQDRRPRDAEVAVRYRGYWFFIPRDDVRSRSVLAILEVLFSIQESEGKRVGPVLTLPAGS